MTPTTPSASHAAAGDASRRIAEQFRAWGLETLAKVHMARACRSYERGIAAAKREFRAVSR